MGMPARMHPLPHVALANYVHPACPLLLRWLFHLNNSSSSLKLKAWLLGMRVAGPQFRLYNYENQGVDECSHYVNPVQ